MCKGVCRLYAVPGGSFCGCQTLRTGDMEQGPETPPVQVPSSSRGTRARGLRESVRPRERQTSATEGGRKVRSKHHVVSDECTHPSDSFFLSIQDSSNPRAVDSIVRHLWCIGNRSKARKISRLYWRRVAGLGRTYRKSAAPRISGDEGTLAKC